MKKQIIVLLGLSIWACSCTTSSVSQSKFSASGRRLLQIQEGMSEREVQEILGKPDEIRLVGGHLIDGVRCKSEIYRWAYGVIQKGTFARTGIVSFDKNRQVVAKRSPVFQHGEPPVIQDGMLPREAAVTPDALSCQLGRPSLNKEKGLGTRHWSLKVTLANRGKLEYVLRYDTVSIVRLVVIELYDSQGFLIFRENELAYHSPFSCDQTEWPTMRIPQGKSISEQLTVMPESYFGTLPPSTYFMRVLFPFVLSKDAKWQYSSSNVVTLTVPEFSEEHSRMRSYAVYPSDEDPYTVLGIKTKDFQQDKSSVRGDPRR